MSNVPQFCPICEKALKYNSLPILLYSDLDCESCHAYTSTYRHRDHQSLWLIKEHLIRASFIHNNYCLTTYYKYDYDLESSRVDFIYFGMVFDYESRKRLNISLEEFNPKKYKEFIERIANQIAFI